MKTLKQHAIPSVIEVEPFEACPVSPLDDEAGMLLIGYHVGGGLGILPGSLVSSIVELGTRDIVTETWSHLHIYQTNHITFTKQPN